LGTYWNALVTFPVYEWATIRRKKNSPIPHRLAGMEAGTWKYDGKSVENFINVAYLSIHYT
ncbi:MAG TPA: hypothetical protein VIJ25_11810, partial [Methylococcales bacterium]